MKKQLALVLAGGGSLGSYEVGAIKALEELGYRFDIVTGTSIGALNGAFVYLNQTDRLESLWNNITPEKVMKNGTNFSKNYILDNKDVIKNEYKNWLKVYVSNRNLGADISPFKEYVANGIDLSKRKDSKIKFAVTCTQIPSMKKINVDMNNIAIDKFLPYLHASSACFPIFPIEVIDGEKYIDGFYNDNLPMKLAVDMGATDIIAIDMRLFSLEPSDKFFIDLPNVSYIAPFHSLGSLVDFRQEIIRKNMQLGYWDTMKYFGKMHGFASNITGEVPDIKIISFLLERDQSISKTVIENIKKGINRPMYEVDYFIRILEIIAENLKIPMTYVSYTFNEFFALIRKECIKQRKEASEGLTIKSIIKELGFERAMDSFLNDFIDAFIIKNKIIVRK